MDIGKDELDNDEGGVSGVLEPTHEADDGDNVLAATQSEMTEQRSTHLPNMLMEFNVELA